MDSKVKIYLERAENEFRLARAVFSLSEKEDIKVELGANPDDSFYSSVISLCYYCIFYCAKAILLTKKIETKVPDEHKKTLSEFKKNFVDNGILDKELFEIYEEEVVKADELLNLFSYERWKRGQFTYKTIPQANIEPAKESVENALKFLSNIKKVLEVKE